ncbi:MAG: FAD-dependent oxidoreductase, partial [Calditrichae bacterium]|nr:FAD-dependent oxidoreductase [Calditrichia bacterium]NIW78989.1 FAD-dependent oxidoreductase [Calditrichia bacterium]
MQKYDYDIIVVGAGPAGCTTAMYAARKGLRVLLLDKKRFPRDKTCGDLIPNNCLHYLEELHLSDIVKESPHLQIRGAKLYSANGNSIT